MFLLLANLTLSSHMTVMPLHKERMISEANPRLHVQYCESRIVALLPACMSVGYRK